MTLESNLARTSKTGRAAAPATTIEPERDNTARSQSLYRKWRSQTFGELVGQDAITRTLQNAISGNRVGHAYLFCGPRGTGKTSSARLLAKALNCTYPDPKARPCNECEPCRAIAEGRAMDLIEIDAASNRGIDEIRSLRDTIGYQPSQFKYKFYIIDEVHMLTEPAFNALLKTLEEPPPHAIFVLATTDPQDIPATVVSRCQRFDFQRISLEQIAGRLAYICGEEGIEADAGALELIARQATGSLRDALSLLDQLIVFSGGQITSDAVRAMLGVMNSEAVAEFVDCLIRQDMAGGLDAINRLVQSGTDLKRFNREVVDYLRILMLIKANPAANELTDMTHEALEVLREQADLLNLGEIIGFLKIFSGVDYNLKVSPYGQLPLEIALMEAVLNRPAPAAQVSPMPNVQRPALAASNPVQRLAPAAAKPEFVEPAPASTPKINSTPSRPAPTVIKPIELEAEAEPVKVIKAESVPTAARTPRSGLVGGSSDRAKETLASQATSEAEAVAEVIEEVAALLDFAKVQEVWARVVESIGAQSKMTQAMLREAQPVAVDGNHVVLSFRFEFHQKQIAQNIIHRGLVENYYSQIIGQKVLVKCVRDDNGSGNGNKGGSGPGNGPDRSPRDEQRRKAAQVFNARIME